jgi:hypothetical protein
MTAAALALGHCSRPRSRTGRPPTPPRRTWWDRLIEVVVWYKRTHEVILVIERVAPHRRAAVMRAWLERQWP